MSEEFKQIYEMIKQCVDLKGTLKLNSICCNDILNYIKLLEQERDKYKSIVDNLKEFAEEEKSKVSKNYGVRTYENKIAPYIGMLLKIKELEEKE